MSRPRWYLSARAVREYAELRGLPLDDGGHRWAAVERALAEACEAAHVVETPDGEPRLTRGGLQEWRTGRAHGRVRMLVSAQPRPEGPLPQVVQVLPSHGTEPRYRPGTRTGAGGRPPLADGAPTRRLTIGFAESVVKQLEAEGRPLAEVVRDAVDQYLARRRR